jgi:uridylate cyclase
VLREDLEKEVATIFNTSWTERDGHVVPSDESLRLGNDTVKINSNCSICRSC